MALASTVTGADAARGAAPLITLFYVSALILLSKWGLRVVTGVFVPVGREETFAELDPDEKHAISHRADAFAKLVAEQFG